MVPQWHRADRKKYPASAGPTRRAHSLRTIARNTVKFKLRNARGVYVIDLIGGSGRLRLCYTYAVFVGVSTNGSTTTAPIANKKPALGGLEKAQALRSLLMASNCKVIGPAQPVL